MTYLCCVFFTSTDTVPQVCFCKEGEGRGGEERRGEGRRGEERGEKIHTEEGMGGEEENNRDIHTYVCISLAVHLQSADCVPEVLTSSSYSTLMAATALATPSFSPATVMSALSTDGGGMLIRVPVWSERALAWLLMKGWNFFSTSRRSKASLACACVCVCVCVYKCELCA